jgi:hypothetical protein
MVHSLSSGFPLLKLILWINSGQNLLTKHNQGSMLWSLFSAIFLWKNWRFSQKPMLWSICFSKTSSS